MPALKRHDVAGRLDIDSRVLLEESRESMNPTRSRVAIVVVFHAFVILCVAVNALGLIRTIGSAPHVDYSAIVVPCGCVIGVTLLLLLASVVLERYQIVAMRRDWPGSIIHPIRLEPEVREFLKRYGDPEMVARPLKATTIFVGIRRGEISLIRRGDNRDLLTFRAEVVRLQTGRAIVRHLSLMNAIWIDAPGIAPLGLVLSTGGYFSLSRRRLMRLIEIAFGERNKPE